MGYSPGEFEVHPRWAQPALIAHVELRNNEKIYFWHGNELDYFFVVDLDNAEKIMKQLQTLLIIAGRRCE